MNKTLQLGFIGGGINSAVGATHFIASQMDGKFKVQSGCFSRHSDINEQTAEQWCIPAERCYPNFEELVQAEKDRIDAIVVLTPIPSHTDLVVQALNLGYPVICEKALANSTAEVEVIRKAQVAHRGYLAVTYNYTGYPMLRELKHRIANGDLGRVEQVHIEMPQEGYSRLNRNNEPMVPQQWRLQDAEIPTLSLDLGVHLHYIIDFLTGAKPQELVAVQTTQGRFQQVVDTSMCIARYSNAIECSIWFSKAALGYRNGLRVRVFGENGSAEWHQMEPELLVFNDNKGHKLIVDRASVDVDLTNQPRYNRFKSGHPAGFIEAFANCYQDIAESLHAFKKTGVQQNSDFVFNTDHAYEGLVMMEAMAQSSNEKCWKTVSLKGS